MGELEAKQKKQQEQLDKQLKQEQLRLEKERKAQEKKLKDEQEKEKKLQEKLKKQQEKEAKEEEKRQQKDSLKAKKEVSSPENVDNAPAELNQDATDVEDLTTEAPEEIPQSDLPAEGETKPTAVSVIKRGVPKNTKPAPAVVQSKWRTCWVKVLLMKKLMKSCNRNLTVRQLQTTRLKSKCRSRSRKNWKSRSSRRLRLL